MRELPIWCLPELSIRIEIGSVDDLPYYSQIVPELEDSRRNPMFDNLRTPRAKLNVNIPLILTFVKELRASHADVRFYPCRRSDI